MIKLEFHEIANLEPMMNKAEKDALRESIAKGYDKNQPIIIYEGKILDGRNRYMICLELNVEPSFRLFEGTYEEASAESVRLNNVRRHKSPSQKAMAAAMTVLESRERFRHDKSKKKIPVQVAAKMQLVSEKYVSRCIKLLELDKQLSDVVFEGKYTLGKAEEIIKNKKEEIDLYSSYGMGIVPEISEELSHIMYEMKHYQLPIAREIQMHRKKYRDDE